MIERSLTCIGPHGFHRLAYYEWPGPKNAPVLLCVHGVTRNGRDFDMLAASLSAQYRVICPDLPGRGKSAWLSDPADYAYSLYMSDMVTLIARLDVEAVDWLGTSMGGIVGMMFAALPGTPLRRLVLNDIGALIPKEGLQRIASYIGQDKTYPDFAALETALRTVLAPFGQLSDAQWHHLATYTARRKPDGTFTTAYDPQVGDRLRNSPIEDVDLWAQWDKITCPVLVLRGEQSDILRRSDAEAMTQRGPRARLVEFAGIGHAPALMEEDQIAFVRDFLLG